MGITGKTLQWFASYLSNRSQSVRIGNSRSRPTILKCGVPLGSPLGSFLFNVNTLPIGDIIRSHGLSFHIYADDNDNYISFKPEDCDQNLVKLRNCIADLRIWLKKHFLMLNDDKTRFAIFGTPQQCAELGPLQMEI